MRMLGAKCIPVDSGSKTLKDAINEAMRDWVTNVSTTHYLVGSAIGPHPFPTIVRDFQCVIGKETKVQLAKKMGKLPDAVVACVGGGSNSIGMFHPFADDKSVRLVGVEAAGEGVETGRHSATLSAGVPGVLHGTRTYLLQNKEGQITETHSISAVSLFSPFLATAPCLALCSPFFPHNRVLIILEWDRSTPFSRTPSGPSTCP